MEFRTLKANEIDCRVQLISEKGLSLLLYKDARVDQNILDETVGAMNWQKKYTRDNANCIVSIWDDDKKQWIEKEDTGTESNTEKEKGLASDSFKRACFNWGIGRELYSSPFIWIPKDLCNITKNDKGKYECRDEFIVNSIGYENKNIKILEIYNTKTKKIVFTFGKKVDVKKKEESPKEIQVNNSRNELIDFCKAVGLDMTFIAKEYKLNPKSKEEEFAKVLEALKAKSEVGEN